MIRNSSINDYVTAIFISYIFYTLRVEHDRRAEFAAFTETFFSDLPQDGRRSTSVHVWELARTNGTRFERQETETIKEIYVLYDLVYYDFISINDTQYIILSSYHVFVAEFVVKCFPPKWCFPSKMLVPFQNLENCSSRSFGVRHLGFQTDPLRISSSLWSARRTKHPDLQRGRGPSTSFDVFGGMWVFQPSKKHQTSCLHSLHPSQKKLWNEIFNWSTLQMDTNGTLLWYPSNKTCSPTDFACIRVTHSKDRPFKVTRSWNLRMDLHCCNEDVVVWFLPIKSCKSYVWRNSATVRNSMFSTYDDHVKILSYKFL